MMSHLLLFLMLFKIPRLEKMYHRRNMHQQKEKMVHVTRIKGVRSCECFHMKMMTVMMVEKGVGEKERRSDRQDAAGTGSKNSRERYATCLRVLPSLSLSSEQDGQIVSSNTYSGITSLDDVLLFSGFTYFYHRRQSFRRGRRMKKMMQDAEKC